MISTKFLVAALAAAACHLAVGAGPATGSLVLKGSKIHPQTKQVAKTHAAVTKKPLLVKPKAEVAKTVVSAPKTVAAVLKPKVEVAKTVVSAPKTVAAVLKKPKTEVAKTQAAVAKKPLLVKPKHEVAKTVVSAPKTVAAVLSKPKAEVAKKVVQPPVTQKVVQPHEAAKKITVEAPHLSKGLSKNVTKLYSKDGHYTSAQGSCYCGCCTAADGKACTAPIGAKNSFKTDSCRSVYCTQDASQSAQWNNDQWTAFCSGNCFATKPGDAHDKSCRAKQYEDSGVNVHES